MPLMPEHNVWHCVDDIFIHIILKENLIILIQILLQANCLLLGVILKVIHHWFR